MENSGDEKVNPTDTFENRTEYCAANYTVMQNYDLAFDIGSNLGGFSCAFNKNFKRIVAVEAHPDTFKKCVSNLNNFQNIKVLNRAASNTTDQYINIFSHENGDSGSATCINNSHTSSELKNSSEVLTISYSSLVEKYGIPDYMKIDIEGSEYDFLMNKDLSGVQFLSLELHMGLLTGSQRKDLMKHLSKYFSVFKHKKGIPRVCHDEFALINWNLHIK